MFPLIKLEGICKFYGKGDGKVNALCDVSLEVNKGDMLAVLGNRKIAVVKEITKIHENVLRTDLWSALKFFNMGAPKGEYVLIIEGAKPAENKEYTIDEALEIAKGLMNKGLSASEAAKEAASVTGIKKGDIYRKMVESVRG